MNLIERIYSVSSDKNGLDEIFNIFDDLIGSTDWVCGCLGQVRPRRTSEDFNKVNEILAQLEPNRLSTQVLTSILTVTFPVRNKLSNRTSFFVRCADEIETRRPGNSHKILKGLGGTDGL